MEHLKKTDPEIYQVLVKEYERQFYHLEMIASENFTSLAVCMEQSMPTCNPTRAVKQTWRFIWRYFNRGTQSLAWTWHTVGT
jgi:hypothetical protein